MTELFVAAMFGLVPAALDSAGALPGRVREVRYVGADHLSSRELRDLAGVRTGDRMDPSRNELGREAILRKYQEDGRYFASVELAEGGKPTDACVVYRVVEGPVVKVGAIEFIGVEQAITGRLRTRLANNQPSLSVGSKFKPSALELGRKEILDYYRIIGFPDATVTAEVKRSADMDRVTIVYHVVEKPR